MKIGVNSDDQSEMGMMVMAETFDEWKTPKVKNGYHLLFDQWAEKDLVNLIRHYRRSLLQRAIPSARSSLAD